MQGGRGEDILAPGRLDIEGGQGLIAQAVAVFQQDQVVGAERARRDRPCTGQPVTERGGGEDLVVTVRLFSTEFLVLRQI